VNNSKRVRCETAGLRLNSNSSARFGTERSEVRILSPRPINLEDRGRFSETAFCRISPSVCPGAINSSSPEESLDRYSLPRYYPEGRLSEGETNI
jgi:hypothetical protein